ncbi:hypothetical protein GCM10010967_23600 [Dyadobacter beijingensis]|uniref:Uncharacterized protein n=1 Tax=Dyadobacter beijingensis TaxID=365489 RepID=A0ABQ2HTZ9_9BACT|nr:hypothetical protein [Dyadobacter beijingensis]GGM89995.1 hypothetical protein GCM10010967_23600 [Dyadobacter beijingensis]
MSEKPKTVGLPTVAYCAGELNLTPKYFGDLIKKETGAASLELTAQDVATIAEAANDLQVMGDRYIERMEKTTGL